MSLLNSLKNLPRKLREVGPLYTGSLLLNRLLPGLCFNQLLFFEMEASSTQLCSSSLDDLRFVWGGPEDQAQLEELGQAPEVLRARFSAGHRVAMLLQGEALRAYLWYASGCFYEEELGLEFCFAPDEIWIYDGVVAQGFRGMGLYPWLSSRAAQELSAEGYQRLLFMIEALNRNSRRGSLKLGAWIRARAWIFRAPGVSLYLRGETLRHSLGSAPLRLHSVEDF